MIQTVLSSQSLEELPKWQGTVNEVENVELSSVSADSSCTSADEADDAIFNVNDLLLERARTIPDEPFVGYPSTAKSAGDYCYYTPKDISRFADGAIRNLVAQGLPEYVNFQVHLESDCLS